LRESDQPQNSRLISFAEHTLQSCRLSIDTNFDDSNDIEFGDGSEVVMLDDLTGVGLRTLYDYLNERTDEDRVEVIARVYDWSPEAYSSLMRHSFKVEKLDCSWCERG
jgi:hypothetical protein